MKNRLLPSLIFFYILLLPSDIFPQSQWYWSNPLPQGNQLNSLCFIDNNTAYSVGLGGSLIKTLDAGENWRVVKFNNCVELRTVNFINSNTGFIVTANNALFKTINAGQNWDSITSFSLRNSKVLFRNNNLGILFGDTNVIYRTTNGGISWFFSGSATDSRSVISDACFLNDNSIKCSGYFFSNGYPYPSSYGFLLSSSNAGQNWNYTQIFSSYVQTVRSICFVDENTGYATGSGSYFAKSTNGGINWYNNPLGNGCGFIKIKFINSLTGYLVGSDDSTYVMKTIDGGISWSTHKPNIHLNDVHVINENTLVGVGNNGDILKSNNSGTNWINKKSSAVSNRLNCVYAVSDNIIYAGGTGGVIIKSSDGGRSWHNQQTGITNFLTSIYFRDSLNGAATSPLYIIHTSNGGNNWSVQYNSPKYMESIYFLDNNTGFACGRERTFLKTTNGGVNWNTAYFDTTSLHITNFKKILFVNQQTGFLMAQNWSGLTSPTIFKTTNRGGNWSRAFGSINGMDLFFLNENTGYSVGYSGEIFKTTNGGVNWSATPFQTNSVLNSVTFINNLTGFIGGYINAIFLKTTNSGLNWVQEQTGLSSDEGIYGLTSFNGQAFYVGDNGKVKTTKEINNVFVNAENNIIPVNFYLYQNSPNPFNPVTRIKFDLSKNANIRLTVFDIIGRKVETMIDNVFLQAGRYSVDFYGSNLASGIYFYTMEYKDNTYFKSSKKMVLLK